MLTGCPESRAQASALQYTKRIFGFADEVNDGYLIEAIIALEFTIRSTLMLETEMERSRNLLLIVWLRSDH